MRSIERFTQTTVVIAAVLTAALGGPRAAYAVNADDIVGIYWNPDHTGKVEIYRKGQKYYGKVACTP